MQLIICVPFYCFNPETPLTTIKSPHQRFMLNLPNEIPALIFFIRITLYLESTRMKCVSVILYNYFTV